MAKAPDLARKSIPLMLGAVLIWVLWGKASELDWVAVHAAFDAISPWRWGAAIAATAISFWAIAQYDVVAHRHFRTGLDEGKSRLAGAAAISIGQTTGFGPAVGAAVRWRLMPALGHADVLRITGFVTLCFMVAWGLLVATIALPVMADLAWLALPLFSIAMLGLAVLLMRAPRLKVLGGKMALPSLRALSQLIVLAACDLVFAGLALYLLLPPDMALPAIVVIAAFSIALGAGMVGGTPGGIGPFELALAALLSSTDHATLAAALIGFRLVYYALPCAAGAAYTLLARPVRQKSKTPATGSLHGARAEHPIAAQNLTRQICSVEGDTPAEACALRSPQTMTLFLGATKGCVSDLLEPLKQAARQENRIPCLYKLDARDAARARKAGWAVRPFAVDAILNPTSFSLDGSERRQLRRALRKSEKAGLRIARIDTPDWAELALIHQAWEAPHGNERGFTMGRFCPLYLGDKHLYGAWQGDKLIAYCSAVDGDEERALDLMRHYPDMPQGTMHALIAFMIEDAKAAGVTQFSLAALPHPSLPARLADCAGLTRFKTCFAPRWKPLYIAAPNHALLLLAALDIRQAILSPNPLPLDTLDQWQADNLIDRAVKPATRLLRRAS